MRNAQAVFLPNYGLVRVNTFSYIYPFLNDYVLKSAPERESRDGKTRELLDVKTQLLNPTRRCVGGYGRNINVFFLLTEAMWIVLGRRDVGTLTRFNSRMKDFSDDGSVFHAPYGWRLRRWGVRSEDHRGECLPDLAGQDQVMNALRIFSENPSTRQVVMSIWNPDFDLGFETKDVPCNDMVMMKIRDGKLYTAIANRSNDLHLGLPTNIFQFSFLSEVMAACLGIEVGTQTHNSQSLHVYDWSKVAKPMQERFASEKIEDLYDYSEAYKIDFHFRHAVPVNRFREVEYALNVILDNVNRVAEGSDETGAIGDVMNFSGYLYYVYRLLKMYVRYKTGLLSAVTDEARDALRQRCIEEIGYLEYVYSPGREPWDVALLAKNYFASRLSVPYEHEYIGRL